MLGGSERELPEALHCNCIEIDLKRHPEENEANIVSSAALGLASTSCTGFPGVKKETPRDVGLHTSRSL